jgi:hypothetical protein
MGTALILVMQVQQFFSEPGILRSTGIGYAFRVRDSISSTFCKHFTNINILLC